MLDQHKYKAVWDNRLVGIVEIDTSFRILRANPTFAELVGQDPANLVGVDVDDITHPSDRGKGKQAAIAAMSEPGGFVRQKKRYVQGDGTIVWASITSIPVRDEATGAVAFWVSVVVQLVSGRKSAEEFEKRIESLENLVAALLAAEESRQATNINVGKEFMSQQISADRGANVSASNNSSKVVIIVCIALAVALISVAAFSLGGVFSYQDDHRSIEVDGND